MVKAFDSLSNNFLDKVLKFFNFGPNIRRWLALIGNKHTACVLLEDGLTSRIFNLGRGRPQGDNISPNTFNFCMQILIFRIEMDTSIEPVPRAPTAPILNPLLPDIFRFESNRETSKNEGLADDNTTLTLIRLDCLRSIKTILEDFSVVSGLVCNFDKTVIMPTNPVDDIIRASIQDLGFTISDSFKLLGLTICRNLDNINEIYSELVTKINSLINFWTRFRLTLPGRLTIMKTCLVSQLNYIGCFLPMPDAILVQLQGLINNFVKKNLQVSAERLCLDMEHGGLGIFNLKDFFQAQHCSWIKRAFSLCIDNWHFDLATLAPLNNILLLRSSDVDLNVNPILAKLVESYSSFYSCFIKINGNYKEAFIFENEAFCLNHQLIDRDFFGHAFHNRYKNIIRTLTFSSCFMGRRFKTQCEFADAGLPLSPATWMRLQTTLLHSRQTLKKNDDTENLSSNIVNFFNKITKGSKQFRCISYSSKILPTRIETLRTVTQFAYLTVTPTPENHTLGKVLGSWNKSFLGNDLRNFLFLLRNNSLPLNNRVNAFDNNVSPLCTFCRIIDRDTRVRDSFVHFFYSCPVTNNLLFQWT